MWRYAMKLKTITIGILLLLILILFIQNTQVVTFQVLFWRVSMSRIILLFFVLLIGFVFGYGTAKVKR